MRRLNPLQPVGASVWSGSFALIALTVIYLSLLVNAPESLKKLDDIEIRPTRYGIFGIAALFSLLLAAAIGKAAAYVANRPTSRSGYALLTNEQPDAAFENQPPVVSDASFALINSNVILQRLDDGRSEDLLSANEELSSKLTEACCTYDKAIKIANELNRARLKPDIEAELRETAEGLAKSIYFYKPYLNAHLPGQQVPENFLIKDCDLEPIINALRNVSAIDFFELNYIHFAVNLLLKSSNEPRTQAMIRLASILHSSHLDSTLGTVPELATIRKQYAQAAQPPVLDTPSETLHTMWRRTVGPHVALKSRLRSESDRAATSDDGQESEPQQGFALGSGFSNSLD